MVKKFSPSITFFTVEDDNDESIEDEDDEDVDEDAGGKTLKAPPQSPQRSLDDVAMVSGGDWWW